jgi:hypothetical protein
MKNATKVILEMVREISKTNPSGEAFFDALDARLSSTTNRWLITAALNKIPKSHVLVLSGGFGKTVADLLDSGRIPDHPYLLFAGGVRKGAEPTLLRYHGCCEKTATFLDDSIYGGATYYKIKDYIEAHTSIRVKRCFAIYDGSPVARPDVSSLFRYYDFFSVTPNFQF